MERRYTEEDFQDLIYEINRYGKPVISQLTDLEKVKLLDYVLSNIYRLIGKFQKKYISKYPWLKYEYLIRPSHNEEMIEYQKQKDKRSPEENEKVISLHIKISSVKVKIMINPLILNNIDDYYNDIDELAREIYLIDDWEYLDNFSVLKCLKESVNEPGQTKPTQPTPETESKELNKKKMFDEILEELRKSGLGNPEEIFQSDKDHFNQFANIIIDYLSLDDENKPNFNIPTDQKFTLKRKIKSKFPKVFKKLHEKYSDKYKINTDNKFAEIFILLIQEYEKTDIYNIKKYIYQEI